MQWHLEWLKNGKAVSLPSTTTPQGRYNLPRIGLGIIDIFTFGNQALRLGLFDIPVLHRCGPVKPNLVQSNGDTKEKLTLWGQLVQAQIWRDIIDP